MIKPFHSYATQAREFSQAPFWFWNDELSESGIARQLDDFQAHGVHASVIHPRAGLPRSLGWMSDELLKYMRFAIEEAAHKDLPPHREAPGDLAWPELQCYLRFCGYGLGYLIGKVQLEQLIADYADHKGTDFRIGESFRRLPQPQHVADRTSALGDDGAGR